MSSWPVNVSEEVDWEAYRLKHASIQEQEAAAAAAKQEPEPTTRKRTTKTDG
jgi:hypothetical protein